MLRRRTPTGYEVPDCPEFRVLLELVTHHLRCEVLQHLAIAPCNVSDLTEIMDLEVRRVSGHLGRLLEYGFVNYDSLGKEHIYRLGAYVEAHVADETVMLVMRTSRGEEITIKAPRPRRKPLSGASVPHITPKNVG